MACINKHVTDKATSIIQTWGLWRAVFLWGTREIEERS
jgi:hypothetical protein